jgi:predicted dehydrogenase
MNLRTRPIRWGILATGGIAHTFATDLGLLSGAEAAEIVAVGSRTKSAAEAFGAEFGIPNRHGSYQDLVDDPEVDVVYVATPHPAHHAATLMCIEAGKAVLCEKPFTMNAAEAEEVIAAARARGTFVMEAMWPRFHPHMTRVREILAEGTLGEIVSVTAEHGHWFPRDPEHRLFNRALGGSALLDLGIYGISFASMVLGPPARMTVVSDPAFTGVDAQTTVVFQYEGGQQAIATGNTYARTPKVAAINGTEARIEIAGPFLRPTTFRVIHRDGAILETFDEWHEGMGLRHEAAEVARCLREGLQESPIMPLDETLSIMKTVDAIRSRIESGNADGEPLTFR